MDVPVPLARVLPALRELKVDAETLATCARCAMAPIHGLPHGHALQADRTFTAPARCCTYHPRLANFLCGSALRRGGVSETKIRARIAEADGVSSLGIDAGTIRGGRHRRRADDDFGRDVALTCPYWVEGPLGCSIHPDRDAVCRTWHCKVVHGLRGQEAWSPINVLLSHVEMLLAEHCVRTLPFDAADPAGMYLASAALVDAMSDAELQGLAGERTRALLRSAGDKVALRDAPMPDVLTTRIRDVEKTEQGYRLTSFSPFDPSHVPDWIFRLLARFDGVRSWREAVDATIAEDGIAVPHDFVPWLWERGLVGPVEDLEGPDEPKITVLPA